MRTQEATRVYLGPGRAVVCVVSPLRSKGRPWQESTTVGGGCLERREHGKSTTLSLIKEDLDGVSVVTASELDSGMMTKEDMRGWGGANTFFLHIMGFHRLGGVVK